MSAIIKENKWLILKTSDGGTIEHIHVPRFRLPIQTPTKQTMNPGAVVWIDSEPQNPEQLIVDAMQAFQRAGFSN